MEERPGKKLEKDKRHLKKRKGLQENYNYYSQKNKTKFCINEIIRGCY